MNARSSAVIIGASSRIGAALVEKWLKDDAIDNVIAISRKRIPEDKAVQSNNVHFIQTEYDEASITQTCDKIRTLTSSISRVCICNGILHNEHIWPEKRIEDISISALQEVFTINSIIPILWLKALVTLVKGQSDCVISVFSARIGSIDDNRSGGWYSYRASKAALNML